MAKKTGIFSGRPRQRPMAKLIFTQDVSLPNFIALKLIMSRQWNRVYS
jgi:hypothetical protein